MDYRNQGGLSAGQGSLGNNNAFSQGPATDFALDNAISKQKAYAAACDAQAAQPARESEAALQRIVHQIEVLNNYSQRVSSVADRLVGSRPKDVGGTAGQTAPQPLAAKLHVLADALSRLNSDMCENADRLESFI